MSVNSSGEPPRGPNPPAYLQLAQAPPHQQAGPGRNGWAVACFLCGLMGILGIPILLCWVFGYLALFQIARSGQTGRLLVHLGFSASGIWILVIVVKAANMMPPTT
ncbi:DUF4190 domain-containing protein [Lentzea sp. NPDC051213]|uniref:DUF4190 domain-containing protein n=1 Tax=Lentzea sp. NPDC051213 TaxID=3364126 RepID=UPI003799071D